MTTKIVGTRVQLVYEPAMGNVRLCLFFVVAAVAACSSSNKATIDAPNKTPDAAIDASPDAKVFMDAAVPQYDFSCATNMVGSGADVTISISGTAETLTTGGGTQAVTSAAVAAYKTGTATAVATTTSGATDGTFTLANISTGGAPLTGYVEASKGTYRTTYLYPQFPLVTSETSIPLIMVSDATFAEVSQFGGSQDDSTNGAVFLSVTDCSNSLITTATLKVQQNGADVGQVVPLGTIISQAAGYFFVFNVPDGDTQISAMSGTQALPVHTVRAYQKPGGSGAEGTLTVTQERPGPM